MKRIWRLLWWFYVREHILTKTKKSGVLAPVHIVGWEMQDRMAAKIAAAWITVAIFELIMCRTGSQCKSERTGAMWQNRAFCATTRARVFWTSWRRVRFETDMPARRELPKSSREPTIAAAMVSEASVVREARMWRSARIWKNKPCMFPTPAYQRTFLNLDKHPDS